MLSKMSYPICIFNSICLPYFQANDKLVAYTRFSRTS